MELKIEDVKKEVVPINNGLGGQSCGIWPRTVRLTHLPTEIVVEVGIHKSQLKNFELAISMLEWGLLQIT